MALNRKNTATVGCVDESCPVARAVNALDGKWTMLIIRDLLGGVRRFSELRASLAGISPKTLTDRLRELEANGLVTRTIYAEIPPRVEYRLTDTGQRLKPVVDALAVWGADLTDRSPEPLTSR
jgi:DNA-binding HxlR family transcriptional regulator